MAEVRRFDIYFKDPNVTYKAGDLVAGSVQLDLMQEMKIRSVKLTLSGVSRVNLNEKAKADPKNIEAYLDEQMIMYSKSDNSATAVGRYDWPFNIRLPSFLPATYEGPGAQVSYWAKAVINTAKVVKGDTSRTFLVLGVLDLNTQKEAQEVLENSKETMTGPSCMESGPISGSIKLEKKRYVAAEDVKFQAKVDNKSNKKLTHLRVQLSQAVEIKTHDNKTKTTIIQIKGVHNIDLNPGQNTIWNGEIKSIPPVVPTNLGAGCKNINVSYLISLMGKPSGMGSKMLDVPVEITIGTIPLRKTEGGESMLTVKAQARRLSDCGELPAAGTVTKPGQQPKGTPAGGAAPAQSPVDPNVQITVEPPGGGRVVSSQSHVERHVTSTRTVTSSSGSGTKSETKVERTVETVDVDPSGEAHREVQRTVEVSSSGGGAPAVQVQAPPQ